MSRQILGADLYKCLCALDEERNMGPLPISLEPNSFIAGAVISCLNQQESE